MDTPVKNYLKKILKGISLDTKELIGYNPNSLEFVEGDFPRSDMVIYGSSIGSFYINYVDVNEIEVKCIDNNFRHSSTIGNIENIDMMIKNCIP